MADSAGLQIPAPSRLEVARLTGQASQPDMLIRITQVSGHRLGERRGPGRDLFVHTLRFVSFDELLNTDGANRLVNPVSGLTRDGADLVLHQTPIDN